MFRFYLLSFFLILASSPTTPITAQELIDGRTSSYQTYLFRLNEEEARSLYSEGMESMEESFLHSPLDSFPTDSSYDKRLPIGHYLEVYVKENKLEIELLSVGKLHYKVINNQRDLLLWVHDSLGNSIQDAEVILANKRIPFDQGMMAYRMSNSHQEGLLRITHQDHTDYFHIDATDGASLLKRVFRRIVFSIPIRWIWRPPTLFMRSIVRAIKYKETPYFIYRTTRSFREYYSLGDWWESRTERRLGPSSYFTTHQPTYRPGDTLKLKAFLMTLSGRKLKRKLSLYISGKQKNGNYFFKYLADLSSYRPGAYQHEFVLDDSLNLTLDQTFTLTLEGLWELEIKETSFRLEDYELKEVNFTARKTQDTHQRGQPQRIFVRVMDANELDLPGSQVNILLTPTYASNWKAKHVFLPNILWTHKQMLDPSGETQIGVPESIFPDASIRYKLHIQLLSAEGERKSYEMEVDFLAREEKLELTYEADSLVAVYLHEHQQQPTSAVLGAYDSKGGLLFEERLYLPEKVPINPIVDHYRLKTGELQARIKGESLVKVFSERTSDSLRIVVQNPRRLPLWYHLYHKNREIQRAQTEQLDIQIKTKSPKNYFLSFSYLWRGKIVKSEYELPYRKRALALRLKHPERIFPGKEVEIDITVTSPSGRRIGNMDVLAYGLNKQFDGYTPPELADLSKDYKQRKSKNSFQDKPVTYTPISRPLNFDLWNEGHRLDSLAIYQFLYPDSGLYRYEVDATDGISQIAPFVVDEKGNLDQVHIIYVDLIPVFFRGASGWRRYSVPVDFGYHSIQLRTRTRKIELDSVYVPAGKKLILSASTFYSHPQKTVIGMPSTLGKEEVNYLSKFLAPLKQDYYRLHSYLKQDNRVYWARDQHQSFVHGTQLFGPFLPNIFSFHSPGEYSTKLTFESGFAYEFQRDLVKMRQIPEQVRPRISDLSTRLTLSVAQSTFNEFAYTEAEILAAWNASHYQEVIVPVKYDTHSQTSPGFGRLEIGLPRKSESPEEAMILVSTDSLHVLRNIQPYSRTIHQLQAGLYELLLFQSDSQYYRFDSLLIQANGINYFQLDRDSLRATDSLIRVLYELSTKRIVSKKQVKKDNEQMKNLFQQRFHSWEGEDRKNLFGIIQDADGTPLIGATVLIKGTTIGTLTNNEGEFSLHVPPDAEIEISYIGYSSQTVYVGDRSYLQLNMAEATTHLDEVVVVGYGIQRQKKYLGYSVSNITSSGLRSIEGKVAGVQVQTSETGKLIRIRGGRAAGSLVYIDGVKMRGKLEDLNLDQDQIKDIQLLDSQDLTSIYGPEAANGVILIQTKSGYVSSSLLAEDTAEPAPLPLEASGMRKNFRDYAFWKPDLRTNRQGKVSFKTTFPDNITQWRLFALAMGKGKYIGASESLIKAYKPLQARLSLPRFLVEGDSALAIGKVQNFLGDSIELVKEFAIETDTVLQQSTSLLTAQLDTISVIAPQTDSLSLTYRIVEEGGYQDGERRSIPVYPRGSKESVGQTLYLMGDTSVHVSFDPGKGPIRIHAESNQLNVLREEISSLHRYPYACNEQAASKLKGLLWEQTITKTLKEPFHHEAVIKQLIKKLEKSQREDGYWGWWPGGAKELWITQHVVEALLLAEKKGYSPRFRQSILTKELVYEAEKTPSWHQLSGLMLLHRMGENVAKKRVVHILDSLEKDSLQSFSQTLDLIRIRQLYELPYALDSVWEHRKRSARNNWYWEGQSWYSLRQSHLLTSLNAYEILRAAQVSHDTLRKVQQYFLESRSLTGYWNTYQAARILASILPDILQRSESGFLSNLTVIGTTSMTPQQFPFDTLIQAEESLQFRKTGPGPLYISVSQRFHESNPEPVAKDFHLKTWLSSEESDQLIQLHKGVPVSLTAQLKLDKDAEYVMIELPIPAGCSYQGKPQSRRYGEVYREYLREKTSIFCQSLKAGIYHFKIDLLPRYSGRYTLNPAYVEEMYFPVFFGRSSLTMINITD
ncbi:MAG: alpha-2-macroglobulin family protein [Bacteroidota bacterium]